MLAPSDVSTSKTLRNDQVEAIDRLRKAISIGKRRIVLQAATGWGKTVVFSDICDKALRKGGRVLFTVPALSLVDQTVEMLYSQGIREVGVIQQQHHMTDYSKPIQVASVQTLQRRGLPEGITVAVIDECHLLFKFYVKDWFFRDEWRNIPIIGLSATPWTKGLGRLYDQLVIAGTTQELIDDGVLCAFKAFAPSHPDLTGVSMVAGDFHEGQLSEAMSRSGLVGDVVDTWNKQARWLPTILFAVDRAHARHLQEKFQAAEILTAYQDGETSDSERAQIKDDFHTGKISVVCSVGTLIVGVDWDVRCIIWARPTKSEILWVQGYGRGLRTAPGKDHCLVLDHADNHARLGFPTEIIHEELHDGRKREANGVKGPPLPVECLQCGVLISPFVRICPECGFERKVVSHVRHVDGDLKELEPKLRLRDKLKMTDKSSVWAGLKHIQETRNYKTGWVAYKYKEIFGVWPRDVQGPAQQPSRELWAWFRSNCLGEFWNMVKERKENYEHHDT